MINLLNLVVYILFILFLFIYKDKLQNKLIKIIIFSLICAPGFFVNNTLINFCDLIIPIIFLLRLGPIIKVKNDYVLLSIYIFIISIIFSLFSCYFFVNNFNIVMLIKSIRIIFIPMTILIFKSYDLNKNDVSFIYKDIVCYGIISLILALIYFIVQETPFKTTQFLWIGDYVLSRAGGIFGEASQFSYLCIIIYSLCLYKNNEIKRGTRVIGIILSIIGVLISYARIAFICLAIVTIFSFLKKITVKKIIFTLIFLIIGFTCLKCVPVFRIYIYDRIFSIFDFSRGISFITSGRNEVWKLNLSFLRKYRNSIFFGIGYKNPISLGDNNFLMCLTQMGIFGLFSFINMLFCVWSKLKYKEKIIKMIFALTLIFTITCDVFTYYRLISIFFIIFYVLKEKKNYDTQNNSLLLVWPQKK